MFLFCDLTGLNVNRLPRKTADAFAKINIAIPPCEHKHSLQVHVPKAECCLSRDSKKGTSLFTSKGMLGASLTVEAALAMTLFLFAVMGLLSVFFVIRTQIQVQSALEQTGNQLAMLPESASLVTARMLFEEKLLVNDVDDSQIVGGGEGISLARSTVMGHQPVVDLVAVYCIRLPFCPEGIADFKIVQRSRKQSFGEARFLSTEKEEYVYISPKGEVYHESMYCSYIKPKTNKIRITEVGERRNLNGERYIACSFCVIGQEEAGVVWITDWGNCYHYTEYCRGIWHNVKQVKLSDVSADRRPCSKCADEENIQQE